MRTTIQASATFLRCWTAVITRLPVPVLSPDYYIPLTLTVPVARGVEKGYRALHKQTETHCPSLCDTRL